MTSSLLSPSLVKRLRDRLLHWFAQEQRCLPWREDSDSYRVWISESMLQQTRVETVIGYFDRFLTRFPCLRDLAQSSEEDVLALWSGLGYYSRARKLREAAILICEQHAGVFPRCHAAALSLPGVGPYTAGAVLSIAYDLPEPLVDGNVQRVFARLFALREPSGSGPLQKKLWALAGELVPKRGGAGDWNQALMELGATLCTPREPGCHICPVAGSCRARELDLVADLPVPKPRKKPTEVQLEIFVARRGQRLLLEKRPPGGRMAGLWQFPTLERAPGGALFPAQFPAGDGGGEPLMGRTEALGNLRHSITRYAIRARISGAQLLGTLPAHWQWFDAKKLPDVPLTGMARKVLHVGE